MFKVQILSVLFLLIFFLYIVSSDEDKESKEATEAFKQWLKDNPEKMKKLKNLQRRACNASVKAEEVPQNLKECYEDPLKAYTGPHAKQLQEISLGVNDNCTKEYPYKDLCNRQERNERFVCYKSGFMAYKKDLLKIYKDEANRPVVKKLFEGIYACFDDRLKKRGA